MADPSSQVAPPLLGHLHCLSKMSYAPVASISVELVGDLLLKAPLAAQQYPFTWTMLDTPPEGSLFLVWVPPMLNGGCASDGFVWADPDQGYSMELPKGYTIEMVQTKSGFIPGQETHTLHTRRRYRLVAGPKVQNFAPGTPPPDPNLWLFHYIHADRPNQISVANIPLGANISQTQNTRRHIASLQQQGTISQKEFFLHDRNTWPSVTFGLPPQMSQGKQPFTPQRHVSPLSSRPPGTPAYYSQPGTTVGQHGSPAPSLPPSKRPKASHAQQLTPAQMAQQGALSAVGPGLHDPPITIDEEEDTSRGDMLDHLTPREISQARYQQHHEWMEEVLGSVYPISKIKPVDLGLGLRGELEEITRGLLDPPTFPINATRKPARLAEGAEGDGHDDGEEDDGNVDPDVLEEFTRRAEAKIKEIEDEITRMSVVHQQRLNRIKKTGLIKDAEKRLRAGINFNMFGMTEPDEVTSLGLGVDDSTPGGQRSSPAAPKNTMTDDEIISMVEESLHKKIVPREMVVRWDIETGEEATGNDFAPIDKDEEMGNTAGPSSTNAAENSPGNAASEQGENPPAEVTGSGSASNANPTTASSASGSGNGGMDDVHMSNDEDILMDEGSNFADAFDTRDLDEEENDPSKGATPQTNAPSISSIQSLPPKPSTSPTPPAGGSTPAQGTNSAVSKTPTPPLGSTAEVPELAASAPGLEDSS
ncbi:hypothetical protein DFH27DRAFT_92689 [Peziza echinospora]|nr:hypothetical protein DFH27DRAFT_92689 [Peziza echinospora]